jgi:acetylornithine deacetylase/succinyl-diaminopimelate desuccinylase-like protein
MTSSGESHLPRLNAATVLADAVFEQETFAASLFDALREGTTRGRGICRDAYGEGENFAHRLLAKTARDLGFLVDHDAAANTYVTMAGRDHRRPRVIIGSHLDSVWDGGNFDGAAGVVAGLIAIKALKESGGNWRLPAARIIGKYDHCCGVPRAYRHDSVVAGADFIHALDDLWREWDAAGRDMAFTVGKFYTDPQQHALTKIAGEASFSLDVRSLDAQSLAQLEERVHAIANAIAARRGVQFELGAATRAPVAAVAPAIRASFEAGAAELGIPTRLIGSGASHDAAAFAQAGIPIGLLFVRNAHGSHNPLEHMEIADLLQATRLLTWWLATHCAE